VTVVGVYPSTLLQRYRQIRYRKKYAPFSSNNSNTVANLFGRIVSKEDKIDCTMRIEGWIQHVFIRFTYTRNAVYRVIPDWISYQRSDVDDIGIECSKNQKKIDQQK
jgi:hypothetical protein